MFASGLPVPREGGSRSVPVGQHRTLATLPHLVSGEDRPLKQSRTAEGQLHRLAGASPHVAELHAMHRKKLFDKLVRKSKRAQRDRVIRLSELEEEKRPHALRRGNDDAKRKQQREKKKKKTRDVPPLPDNLFELPADTPPMTPTSTPALFPAVVALDRKRLFALERWARGLGRVLDADDEARPTVLIERTQPQLRQLVMAFVDGDKQHFPHRARVVHEILALYERLLDRVTTILNSGRAVFETELEHRVRHVQEQQQAANDSVEAAEARTRAARAQVVEMRKELDALRAKVELYAKFVFVKTGATDIQEGDTWNGLEEAAAARNRKPADEMLPSQLYLLMRDSTMITDHKRKAIERRALKDGDEPEAIDGKTEEEEQGEEEVLETADFLKSSIRAIITQLNQRAGERRELSLSFKKTHREEEEFLEDLADTLEGALATSQTSFSNFTSNVLSDYRSRHASYTSTGVQTDGTSTHCAVGDGALAENTVATTVSTRRTRRRTNKRTTTLNKPASPVQRARSLSPGLERRRSSAMAVESPPTGQRRLSVVNAPAVADPVEHVREMARARRRASVNRKVDMAMAVTAGASPSGSAAAAAAPVVVVEKEATNVSHNAASAARPEEAAEPPMTLPIAIPRRLRELLGDVYERTTHMVELSPHGLVAVVEEILREKTRANRIDDSNNRQRQDMQDFVFDFFLERHGPAIATAKRALVDVLLAVHELLNRPGAHATLRWFGLFVGLTRQFSTRALETVPPSHDPADFPAASAPSLRAKLCKVGGMGVCDMYLDAVSAMGALAAEDDDSSMPVAKLPLLIERLRKNFPFRFTYRFVLDEEEDERKVKEDAKGRHRNRHGDRTTAASPLSEPAQERDRIWDLLKDLQSPTSASGTDTAEGKGGEDDAHDDDNTNDDRERGIQSLLDRREACTNVLNVVMRVWHEQQVTLGRYLTTFFKTSDLVYHGTYPYDALQTLLVMLVPDLDATIVRRVYRQTIAVQPVSPAAMADLVRAEVMRASGVVVQLDGRSELLAVLAFVWSKLQASARRYQDALRAKIQTAESSFVREGWESKESHFKTLEKLFLDAYVSAKPSISSMLEHITEVTRLVVK